MQFQYYKFPSGKNIIQYSVEKIKTQNQTQLLEFVEVFLKQLPVINRILFDDIAKEVK
jgi:hypothetical protein